MQENVNRIAEMRSRMAEAERYRSSGKPLRAKKIVADVLKKHPDYHAAWHTLGLIESELGNETSEFEALTKALIYNPENYDTHVALAASYCKLGRYDQAQELVENALPKCRNKAEAYLTQGTIYQRQKNYVAARDALAKSLQLAPGWREPMIFYGSVLTELGETSAAYDTYMELLKTSPVDLEILYPFCQVRGAHDKIDFLKLLEKIKPEALKAEDRTKYYFCASDINRYYENFEESWRYLEKGNELVRKTIRHQAKTNANWQRESLAFLQAHNPKVLPINPDAPISLFILGASRSGKTTLESVIASSPKVFRGYESMLATDATAIVLQKHNCIPNTQLASFPRNFEQELTQLYDAKAKERIGSAPIFTSTGPSQIHDANRLPEIITNAFFVLIKRSKLDLAYRIFAKHFSSGNYYAYDLDDVFEHIDWYEAMIDNLAEKMPERCTVFDYEDLVNDPASAVKAVEQMIGQELGIGDTQVSGDVGASTPFLEFMDVKGVAKSHALAS